MVGKVSNSAVQVQRNKHTQKIMFTFCAYAFALRFSALPNMKTKTLQITYLYLFYVL